MELPLVMKMKMVDGEPRYSNQSRDYGIMATMKEEAMGSDLEIITSNTVKMGQ